MFRNSQANKVISIVAAFVLWFYVVGSVDPTIQQKYEGLPIELLNVDSITQQGLSICDSNNLTVDITLEGSRADLKQLDQSDIKVTADLYGRHEGSNYLNVDVSVPKEIKVASKSVDKILVMVEPSVTQVRPVEVKVRGNLNNNLVLGDTIVNPKEVEITGARSTLKRVSKLVATVNASKLSSKDVTVESDIVPIDSNGSKVDFVELGVSRASVTTSLEETKEVKLNVNTKGKIDKDLTIKSIDIPDTIWIQGDAKDIDNIKSIDAPDVDISQVTTNVKLPIYPNLPEGVKVANKSKDIGITIKLANQESKEFSYSEGNIDVNNLDEGLEIDSIGTVTVTAYGSDDAIRELSKEDIYVSVNVEGLEAGTHIVHVSVHSNKDNVSIKSYPDKIKVVLR